MTDFRYECSNGHYIESNGEVHRCPVVVKGSPCQGDLRSKGRKPTLPTQSIEAENLAQLLGVS